MTNKWTIWLKFCQLCPMNRLLVLCSIKLLLDMFFRLFLGYYVTNQKSDGNQRVREKQILTQILDCLVCTVTIATQQYPSELNKFLESFGNFFFNIYLKHAFNFNACNCFFSRMITFLFCLFV